jgi:hypothetical protein
VAFYALYTGVIRILVSVWLLRMHGVACIGAKLRAVRVFPHLNADDGKHDESHDKGTPNE